jgi:hypothetical protein
MRREESKANLVQHVKGTRGRDARVEQVDAPREHEGGRLQVGRCRLNPTQPEYLSSLSL